MAYYQWSRDETYSGSDSIGVRPQSSGCLHVRVFRAHTHLSLSIKVESGFAIEWDITQERSFAA